MSGFDQLVSARRALGRESYSAWDEALYDRICQESGAHFWAQSGNDVAASESYLALVAEGISRGYITEALHPAYFKYWVQVRKWHGVLEFWLVMEIPRQIAAVPPAKRAAVMAALWNLGENILRERSWIAPYVLKQLAKTLPALHDVEACLQKWLEPVLQEPKPARWIAPFEVDVLNGREIQDDFLPGEMELSAPAIVCVKDRRLDNIFAGIFLHEKRAEQNFHHAPFGTATKPVTPEVDVRFTRGQVKINGQPVALPSLNNLHSHLVCANGVVLASARDSQRIWIIRSQ